MNWTVWEHGTELHIVPESERGQHRLFGCWCKPKLEHNLALSPVWVHHSKSKKTRKSQVADELAKPKKDAVDGNKV
jgi:hypothetical protein